MSAVDLSSNIKKLCFRLSFGEKFPELISAEAWISNSFMIVVMDVVVSDNSWEFSLVEIFASQ